MHVIIGLGAGGAEQALRRLVTAQQALPDYQPEVVSLRDLGVHGEALRRLGVPVHALGLTGMASLPRVFLALVGLLRQRRPALVHTWMYHADLLGALAARLAGRPPVLWSIRSFDLRRGAGAATRLVQRLCALVSSHLPTLILCVAEASRRSHAALGYDDGKMRVVPNGFDPLPPVSAGQVQQFRAAHGLGPEHLVVGCVGRFHPAKDHRNLVAAAALLQDAFPAARFLLVGRGLDAGNGELRGWIEAAGLGGRFVLLGERRDVPLCLAAMDVFCSPSRSEAFPQAVGEAMLMARPAVLTDVGDTARLAGDAALLVERENPRALADGLARLLSTPPAQRAALGARAQARVLREFSSGRSVALTLQAYEEALQAGHRQG